LKLTIQPAARLDILHDYDRYVQLGLSEVAARFLTSVRISIEAAVSAPHAGAPKALPHPDLAGLRSWPVKGFRDFRIYYLADAAGLRVIRVLHGKRDLQVLLESHGEDPAP
jgi:toxin ParE1/3/4